MKINHTTQIASEKRNGVKSKMKKNAHNFKDLSGQVIRNWKVIEDTGKRIRRDPIWKCICLKCNKEWEVSGNSLRNKSSNCKECYYKIIPGKKRIKTSKEQVESQLYARYKCEAKNRSLQFSLTKLEFINYIYKECFYCGKEKSSYQKSEIDKDIIYYNGIDRVDNLKGYELTNCVTCCKQCNVKKKSITPDMIKKAYNFLFGDKNV